MVRKIARVLILNALLMGALSACQSTSQPPAVVSEWSQYQKEFLADLWKTFPSMATGLGLAQYAQEFKIPNALYRQERIAFYSKYKARLEQLNRAGMTSLDVMDFELVQNFLNSMLWEENVFRSAEWDPSQYNAGTSLAALLENGKTNEKQKLRDLTTRLTLIPEYYDAAFKNITVPTREHTDLAIQQNEGFVSYLESDVKARFNKSSLTTEEKSKGLAGVDAAVQGVRRFIGQLKDLRARLEKRKGFRSFRIGRSLYAQKFKYDLQSSYSAEQIYLKAVKTKQEIHREMLSKAKQLWPKYFPHKAPPANATALIRKVIDRLAENHIESKQFVATVEKQLPVLNQFIKSKDLLTMDPSKPLKVRATPLYARGFAGASVDAPGPFDASRETYYNVTPLDDMPPDKQQNYLREYNNYTLQILNIHEAIPGHYVQLVYSLKNPSLIKSIFGSSTMIEGWAVYGERMMMEEGYGDHQPELELMYDKWRLRVVCNVILDYSLHNLNMSKEAAVNLLKNEAFQEDTQIEEKWKRATYSQVQLASYFTGFSEIYELRAELKKQKGDKFSLKEFNEKVLSYGSSPVSLIRREMLNLPGASL